jgi:hypothetical protein
MHFAAQNGQMSISNMKRLSDKKGSGMYLECTYIKREARENILMEDVGNT